MKSQNFVLHAGDPERVRILANCANFLSKLPDSKSWQVSISRYVKKRSPQQRKALFAAAYGPIMEFVGLRGEEDKEELHAFFCGEYWGWRETPLTRRRPVRTTTRDEHGERNEINTLEALDFYAFIQQRAAEQGIYVPDPDPFWREAKAA